MANLEVNFCGKQFKNPLVLASGICGITGALLSRIVKKCGAGAVTTKSIWLKPHEGHKNPVVICNEHWMLNAVGLPDAGINKAKEELSFYRKNCKAPLIASIVAFSIADFEEVTREVAAQINPDILEINISCPNVEDEFGKPFSCAAKSAMAVTKAVRANTKLPISIKLSPNVANIAEIAKAVESEGADAITAINTLGPGMAIDIDSREPILANKVGGLSGPGIKPIAIRSVYDIAKAVKIPIIGTGGILTGEDALEMMMAGASLVGIGSGLYYRGTNIFKKVTKEMDKWLSDNSYASVSEIIGLSQKK